MNLSAATNNPGKRPGKPETLADLTRRMCAARDEYKAAAIDALESSMEIGRIARKAKVVMGRHKKFTSWLEVEVTGLSVQWVRKCMRASEAYEYVMDRNDAEVLLQSLTSVEKFAKLHRRLRDGDPDPLADHIPGILGRPAGLKMSAELRKLYDQLGDLHRLIRQGATHHTAWTQLQYIAKHAPKPAIE